MRKPKTNRKQSFYSKDKDEQKIFVKLRKEFKKAKSELSFEEWVRSNIAHNVFGLCVRVPTYLR